MPPAERAAAFYAAIADIIPHFSQGFNPLRFDMPGVQKFSATNNFNN